MRIESSANDLQPVVSAQENAGSGFLPAEMTNEQIIELAKLVAEQFFFNFVSTIFGARDKIIQNGEVNFEKLCEAQAEAYKVNAEAADVMAKRLAATQTSWGVEYFTKWRDAFEHLSQVALDPVLEARGRLEIISAELNTKFETYFPTINGNVKLRKLVPYLGNAWDFRNMAAALLSNDRKAFCEAASGLVGGFAGAIIAELFVVAGAAAGWEAVLLIGVMSVAGSVIGGESESLQDGAGAIFDFILGHKEDFGRFLKDYEFGLGTIDDDVIVATEAGKSYFLISSDGADWLTGNERGDVIEGGGGNDRLEGEGGNDTVSGGNGEDIITGGAGSDALEGGNGFDTYKFSADDLSNSSSRDVIEDADGQGVIKFNDLSISGTGIGFDNIREASLGTWETANGEFRLVVVGAGTDTQSLLIIRRLGDGKAGGQILVKNWHNGDLGIVLPNFDEAVPANGLPLSGDDDLFGFYAGPGNNSGNDTVNGLGGNDGMSGFSGDDTLDGGAGDDLIFGGHGNDKLYGGDGNDEILDGTERVEFFEEWDDEDEVEAFGGMTQKEYYESEIARLGSAVVARGKTWYVHEDGDGYTLAGFVSDLGSFGEMGPLDANLYPSGDDFIDGGAGNDRILSGEGDDIVLGGEGDDRINGGHDNDVINGGAGNDSILGDINESGVSNEHFTFWVSDNAERNGNDVIDGGAGDDEISGQGGNDVIYGGIGNDTLMGRGEERAVDGDDTDSDYIDGGDGDDFIRGDDGDDTLIGGTGVDTIRGDQETAQTVSGNDFIDGGAGDDLLYGDGGDDTVRGGAGADQIQGDELTLQADKHGNDMLSGGDGNDIMAGLGGDDVLLGDDGDDQLIGDAAVSDLALAYHGNDQLFGGAGNDLAWGGGGNDTMGGGAGNDQMDGEQGDDTLAGGEGDDQLVGGAGDDSLAGDAGNDTLAGNEGDDTISGGAGIDILDAGAGNDALEGGSGDDSLDGDEGDDFLSGGDGSDALYGGAGNDTLIGGSGNDGLAGAEGNDRYVFSLGWGQDSVQGLSAAGAGRDVIQFGSGILPTDLEISVDVVGNLTLAVANGTDRVTLLGFLAGADAGHSIQFADGTTWTQASLLSQLAPNAGGSIGDESDNLIVGVQGGGSNVIYGGLGSDLIIGGSGNDTIHGDENNPSVSGPSDNDRIFGGAGTDFIYAENGNDLVDAGAGSDYVYGGEGEDRLFGGEGSDQLYAGESRIVGGAIVNETSNDFVNGGAGNDILSASLGTNTYFFEGQFGQDTVYLTQASDFEASALGHESEYAILRFGPDISAADLVLVRQVNLLIVTCGSNQLTIQGYGTNYSTDIEFVFDDGSSLSEVQLAALGRAESTPLSDILSGTREDDLLEGLGGDDALYGKDGNDILVGGEGRDSLRGDIGDDTYRYGLQDGVDSIENGSVAGLDVLELGAGIARNDVTFHKQSYGNGNAALYIVVGATGNYIKIELIGAQSDQRVDLIKFADGSSISIAEADAASVPMTFQLYYAAQQGETSLVANQYANYIQGNGSYGTTLLGGKGDDIYDLSFSGYRGLAVEYIGEGNDTIISNEYVFTLPENIENLILKNDGYFYTQVRSFTGNALDNVIDASGATLGEVYRLDGGAGADILVGSTSENVFVVDNALDKIFESAASTSLDTVEASISYSLEGQPQLENIKLVGEANLSATGNEHANVLTGNAGANTLVGEAGNDTLNGGAGSDTLIGGDGDDSYVSDGSDSIVELAGGGTDYVLFDFSPGSATSVALADNVENGKLANRTNLVELLGNAENNVLTGNNVYQHSLRGLDGDDTLVAGTGSGQLYGDAGNDTLTGASGWDILNGGSGADTMRGLGGNDTYFVDSSDDVVIEETNGGDGDRVISSLLHYEMGQNIEIIELAAGAQSATGRELADQMYGNDSANTLSGLGGADVLEGRAGDDILSGGAGNDTLDGGSGSDTLNGDEGDDTLQGGEGSDLLDGGEGNDNLNDVVGDNVLRGGAGTDWLQAGDGSDVLEGGVGADNLFGGNGADTYAYKMGDGSDYISDGGTDGPAVRDALSFAAGVGTNDVVVMRSARYGNTWVEVGGEIITLNGVEDIRFADGTVWDVQLVAQLANDPPESVGQVEQPAFIGKAFSWTIASSAFYDEDALTYSVIDKPSWLAYNSGTQTFTGTLPGSPSSAYSITVRATDSAGQWTDLVVEIPVLNAINGTSSANTMTGTSAAEGLFGLGGNDTLNGAGGNDYLYGGAGDDTYTLDGNSDDIVIEALNEGTDTVSSSASYSLTDNVENLTLTGSATLWGEGNVLNNVLTGNNAANELYGNAGNDSLLGNGGSDYIDGGEGNDTLNGGSSADEMHGGEGNDTYVVDNAGDVATEQAGEGTDLVQSSVTYTLSSNVENLTLTGSSGLSGTGNALDNVLIGNSGANTLRGYEGNDTLDGGTGNDTMLGGVGNDTYVVNATGDVVTELAGEGIDLVQSSVTYTLGNNVENLTLTGTSAINGTGNTLDNVLTGNSGNNTLTGGNGNDTLDGGAGNDTMVGGTGDDTYFVNTSSDVVTEQSNQGVDTVVSGITYTLSTNLEHLTLSGTSAINGTGNASNNRLTGNSGNNALSAAAGDDVLEGGAGTDTLTGGTGKDTYVMARGYGADTVVENDTASGQLDVARFLSGVSYDQLWFARPSGSNNLEITIIGTGDVLIVKDWYLGSQYRVEEIRTTDGNMLLTAAKVQDLVTAMAGLTKPAMGQTTLPIAYQTQLASVFASTWTSGGQGLRAGGGRWGELMAVRGAATNAMSEGTTAGIMAGGCLPAPWQDRVADRLTDIGGHANEGRIRAWLAEHGYASIEDWLESDARPELPVGDLLDRVRDRRYTEAPTGDTPSVTGGPWVVGEALPRPELVNGQAMHSIQEWLSTLEQNPQTGVDDLYQSLVERYAQEGTSLSNPVLDSMQSAHDSYADVASNYQRLISAMSLAGARESSLAASCEARRDRSSVEVTFM